MVSYPTVFDTNPADIAPVAATAAAGAIGKMADSGHAHLGMSLLAATPAAGYTLVNGTGNIITWTAPNDGAVHRVMLLTNQDVTVGETGGLISYTVTTPDGGGPFTNSVYNSGQTTGIHTLTQTLFVKANTTVTVQQGTALTAGAAVLWAEFWGY